jgi:hypothetical protein
VITTGEMAPGHARSILTLMLMLPAAMAYVVLPVRTAFSTHMMPPQRYCAPLCKMKRRFQIGACMAVTEGIQAALVARMKTAMKAREKQELAAVRLMVSAMTTKQKASCCVTQPHSPCH